MRTRSNGALGWASVVLVVLVGTDAGGLMYHVIDSDLHGLVPDISGMPDSDWLSGWNAAREEVRNRIATLVAKRAIDPATEHVMEGGVVKHQRFGANRESRSKEQL